MATDMDRFVSFEEAHYDQYDYYNLREYPCHAGGKGRTKREIELNTNRHCPAGHERKIAEKYHNSERRTQVGFRMLTMAKVSLPFSRSSNRSDVTAGNVPSDQSAD